MPRYALSPEDRARRSAATALMTKCVCGNVAGLGQTECGECRGKQLRILAEDRRERINAGLLDLLKRLRAAAGGWIEGRSDENDALLDDVDAAILEAEAGL